MDGNVQERSFKVLGVNHVGLVPKDLEGAKHFFSSVLKLKDEGSESVVEQQVNTYIYSLAAGGKVESRVELLEALGEGSPISKYKEKFGGGIHHIALEVDSIELALSYLKANKIQLIDTEARAGVHNTKVIFIHPRATGGILVELVESQP